MRRVLPAIVLLTAFIAVAAAAQEEDDYTNWMKEVDHANGNLQKELKAKTGDPAADDAKKLAEIFGQVEQFWQKRNADDAVKFAADDAAAYKQVADLAAAGKFDEASAAVKSAQANCSGCHKAHRASSLHGWKIK
jgi:cytochrome c556